MDPFNHSLLGFACLARFWWRIACGRWRTSDIRLWNRLWAPIKVNWSFYGIKLHSKAFLKHLQVSLWLQTGFEKKVVCNEREQNFKTRGILDMGAGSWSSTFLLPCFVELSKYRKPWGTSSLRHPTQAIGTCFAGLLWCLFGLSLWSLGPLSWSSSWEFPKSAC